MRNLKKILALVLALVMSLSLMATAGAADAAATSSETVTPAYEIALQVLGKDGLKVFGGYTDGTIRPQNNITRAEVAAILYRIVTGDVTDAQAGIYTDMANVNFNDLTGANWAKGYINYCANAQLIVGVGGNQFKPLANITGYATLAMILRALGYDKNGEFKGSGWEIRTASKARELGILKNVSENQLGSSATRELVAELLFRAMLCDKVTYNALTQDYDKTGVTLGYSVFTLEEVKGVVVANEYADIRDKKNTPAADDTTVLRDSEGKDRTVNYASGLEDLGETRVAYTIENGKRDQYDLKNVKLENPGVDSIAYDGGEEKTAAQVTALIGRTDDNTKHLINFGESADRTDTTIKVTYVATAIVERISARTTAEAVDRFFVLYPFLDSSNAALRARITAATNLAPVSYAGGGLYDVTYRPAAVGTGDFVTQRSWAAGHTYNVVNNVNGATLFLKVEIAPNSVFNAADDRIVTSIFNNADLVNNGTLIEEGAVYRGTQTAHDYSDWRSYEAFLEDCFDIDENTTRVTTNGKGYWLKVIDNDNDGVTDWVFQTRYTVASVQSVNDSGVPTLETETSAADLAVWDREADNVNRVNRFSSAVAEDTVEAGDVVYYAAIDGVARVWKAEGVDVRVDVVNRNTKTATVDGNSTPYEESANHEHSARIEIDSEVVNLAGKTNYTFYLDKFGYLAAFAQNAKGNFTVLTDGWFHSLKNGAEYAVQAWDVDAQAIAQYDVTSGGDLFIDRATGDGSNSWGRIRRFNQVNCNTPAVAITADADDVHTIAAYIETDGETATLLPVDMVYDTQRIENGRAVEMIDMGTTIPGNGINASANPGIYSTLNSATGNAYAAPNAASVEVRALSSTAYYYVYQTVPGDSSSMVVRAFEGYSNGANWDNLATTNNRYVEDVYVVGTRAGHIDATAGNATLNNIYYTANVVVVELNDNYYRDQRDHEEVFIYDFESVNNRVNIEHVWAINEKGEKVEYDIDLTQSSGVDQRLYDVANAKRMPGLFYLHRTSTADVWAVERMSHADIRTSGHYDVGTVEYSAATLGNNYYHAKNWVYDHALPGATANHAFAGAVPALITETTAKQNTTTSLYYGLSYGTSIADPATLTEYGAGNAATCLREDIGDNINGGANQVLVRYSGNNIVYAISFAHGTNFDEDSAQRVWRSVLLNPPTDFDLTFYGVGDDDTAGAKVLAVDEDDLDKHTNYIEVSYATAKAWQNANPGKNPLQITGATAKVTWTGLIKDIPTIPEVDGMTYVVEVTRNDGVKEEPYYLKINAASANAVLVDGDGVAHTDAAVKIPYNGIETTLENVLKKFSAGERGTLSDWTVKDENGDDVKYGETSRWAAGYTAEVTVTPENGKAADAKTFTITFGETVKPTPDPVNLEVKIGETGENVKTFYTDPTTYDRVNLNSKFAGLSNAAFTNGATFSMTKDDAAPASGDYISAAYLNSIANNGKWELKVEVNGTDVTATETAAGFDFGEITADTTIVFTYTFKTETLPSGGGETGGEVPVGPRPIEPSAARTQVLADSDLRAEVVYRYVNKGAEKIYVWNSVENGFANGVDVITPKYPCPIDDDDIAYLESQGVDVDPANKDIWAIGYRYKASEGAPDLIVWSYEPYNKPDTPTEVSAVAVTLDTETAVEIGGTLPEAETTTAGVKVETVWTNAAGEPVTTAAAAGTYTAAIKVTAEEGYVLADEVTYTLNGETVKDLTAEITVADPTVEPTEVSAVEITWDTKTAVAIDGTLPVASTETEGVTVATEWKNADGDVVTTAAAAGTYTGKVTVTAKPGYKLADEVTYTVNGEAATAETLGAEIEVKAAPVEGEIVVSIDTTGAGELATVKVTKSDGTEIKDGDTVKAGDRLTVDAAAAEGKNVEVKVTINEEEVTKYTAASDDKEIKIVVTAAAKEMPVKVSYVDGSGAALPNYNNADVTVTVDGAAPTAATTAKAGSKITATLKADTTNAVTVKVNGTEVKFDEKGVAEYVVTEADTKLEVEVIVAAKVTLSLTPNAANILKDITLNGEKKDATAQSAVTFSVAPGSEIVLTMTKGTAAKANLVAEVTTGGKGEVWGGTFENDTVTLTLPNATNTGVAYTLYTKDDELTKKVGTYTAPAGINWTVDFSNIYDANDPQAIISQDSMTPGTLVAHKTYTELLSTLFVGADTPVTFVSAVNLQNNPMSEITATSHVTTEDLAKVYYMNCKAGDVSFKLYIKRAGENAPVKVLYGNTMVGTYTPGTAAEITVTGMTVGSRYQITSGTKFYKVTSGNLAENDSPNATTACWSEPLTEGTLTFTIPVGITTNTDIVITDGLYKVTSVKATDGTAADAASYVKAQSEIKVANFVVTNGKWFTMTTAAADGTKTYYDETGASKGTTPYFIGLTDSKTANQKDFVAKMPAADNVIITAGFFKVEGGENTTLKSLFSTDASKAEFVEAGEAIYVKASKSALVKPTGDTNKILVVFVDTTKEPTLFDKDTTDANVKVTDDCTLTQGAFTEIQDVNGSKYYLKSASLDFAQLAKELNLGADEYVLIEAGANESGAEPAKFNSDGKLILNGDTTVVADNFIKVSSLKSDTAFNAGVDTDYIKVTTGFVSLTVDATNFSDTGKGVITGLTVTGLNSDFTDKAITAGEKTVIYVKNGNGALLNLTAGQRFVLQMGEGTAEEISVLADGTKGGFVDGNVVWTITNIADSVTTPADPSVTE